jgi:hypothetical protein
MRRPGWFPPRRGWPASCAGVRPVVPGPAQGNGFSHTDITPALPAALEDNSL